MNFQFSQTIIPGLSVRLRNTRHGLPAGRVVAILALVMLALSLIAVSPVQAAVLKNEPTGSGSSISGAGAGCFVSTGATVEASFFISDWPISSLLGFLALIGLLWLGKKKKVNGWEGEKVNRKKRWFPVLSAYRIGHRIGISLRAKVTSRFSDEKLELDDPGELEEVRQRIEERPDGIITPPHSSEGFENESISGRS